MEDNNQFLRTKWERDKQMVYPINNNQDLSNILTELLILQDSRPFFEQVGEIYGEVGSIYLKYQPQISLKTNTLVGAEALLRWEHPQAMNGFIHPQLFVEYLENTNSINKVGEWIISQVCRQAQIWAQNNISPPRIGVNVSGIQFQDSMLSEHISSSLNKYEIEGNLLELEITETQQIKDLSTAIKNMDILKDMGIRLALDDFPTGYSTIEALLQFPIDTIKIDKSFTSKLLTSSSCFQNILNIAEARKLDIIVEGVETAKQNTFLCSLNYPYQLSAQGFYYGKAMHPEELEAFIQKFEKNLY